MKTKQSRSKKHRGLKVVPFFHRGVDSPFDTVKWSRREVSITDDNGKLIFTQKDIEAPADWSDLAVKIAASKYFYGDIANGTDPFKGGRENSVRQLVARVVDTIADWGIEDGYFASAKDAENFRNELTWLCVNQHGAFNSPVWFNVGLHHKYGVGQNSGLGNFVFNPVTGDADRAPTQYENPQCSACFIQSVSDDMEGIMELARSEAMLFKYGSGSGTDLTPLRSTREKLSGGGRPSGPMSFLKVYDQVAGTIKSGGKTRRAAKMNTLKAHHPDIEEFIDAKSKEERKAWALTAAGYDGSWNGEAYQSVMYQNENLSVRASDEFMLAALNGTTWWTKRITDGAPCEEKNAADLLRKIAEGTHLCGDPGMQFDDTIDTWHTCKGTERQHSTNPCSEYLFLNNTACNLASLNLMKFKRENGVFDEEKFAAACRIFIIAQDIVVDRSSYPTRHIAINSHVFRTLGLGFANIGSLIMSYGYGYDSDEGRSLAGAITALMTGIAYETSAEMAAAKEPFAGYYDAATPSVPNPVAKDNVEPMLNVIRLHREAAQHLTSVERSAHIVLRAKQAWDDALALGEQHGYRNAQVTVLAPTGTIGFLMDCGTTGIEPAVGLVVYKTLAGGGLLKLVNPTVPFALQALGYTQSQIEEIQVFIEENGTIEGAPYLAEHHLPVFDCAFTGGNGSRSLTFMGHLKMMAACQPFLSGAISKTVNLPSTATVDDIYNTYLEGWKMGLKAIALYRDGSKGSAPLSTKKTEAKDEPAAEVVTAKAEAAAVITAATAPRRRRMPDTRESVTHKFSIGGHEGYITVGLFEDGAPGEVFIKMSKEGSTVGGLMDTIGVLLSMSFQNGVPLESITRKFAHTNFEPSGFTINRNIQRASSVIDYVARWMDMEFGENSPRRQRAAQTAEVPAPVLEAAPSRIEAPVITYTPVNGNGNGKTMTVATGNCCHKCGSSAIVKTGTCGACLNCGESQGCS